jgi:hypothetical protein
MKKVSLESVLRVINVSFILGLASLIIYNMVVYGFFNCSI